MVFGPTGPQRPTAGLVAQRVSLAGVVQGDGSGSKSIGGLVETDQGDCVALLQGNPQIRNKTLIAQLHRHSLTIVGEEGEIWSSKIADHAVQADDLILGRLGVGNATARSCATGGAIALAATALAILPALSAALIARLAAEILGVSALLAAAALSRRAGRRILI